MMKHIGANSRRALATIAVPILVLCSAGCDDDGGCPPEGMSNCDPVDQLCCPEGQHCVLYYGSSGTFIDSCLGGDGQVGEGAACLPNASSGYQACMVGLTCLMTGGDSGPVCHRICHDDDDCGFGASCRQELEGVSVRACLDD